MPLSIFRCTTIDVCQLTLACASISAPALRSSTAMSGSS